MSFYQRTPIELDYFPESQKLSFAGDALRVVLRNGEEVSSFVDQELNETVRVFEIEYMLTAPCIFNGSILLIKNCNEKDYCQFEVHAPDANTGEYYLAKQYVKKWYLDDTTEKQPVPVLPYGACLPALVKLVTRYFKYGDADVTFRENYLIHQKVGV